MRKLLTDTSRLCADFPGEWFLRDPVPVDPLNDVAFAQGTFVAVGIGSAYTSIDGKTWAGRHVGTSANFMAITYGAGQFVAVGSEQTIITSPDGLTWTRRHWTYQGGYLTDVAYGAGRFVTVGADRTVLTSTDGMNWSEPAKAPVILRAVTFGNGLFVGAAAYFDSLWSSPDGITWTAVDLPYSFEPTLASRTGMEATSWYGKLECSLRRMARFGSTAEKSFGMPAALFSGMDRF